MRSWKHEWIRALNDLEAAIDIPSDAKMMSSVVEDLYINDENRHYHTVEHIFTGLDLFDLLESETRSKIPSQCRYAWLCHDASYDPHSVVNEERSAFLASSIVRNILPEDAILSTKIGFEGFSIAGKTLCDIDWAYFGYSYEEFMHKRGLIRLEYSHLSDDEWKAGSKKFIEFINPEEVYFHKLFKIKYEKNLKDNITKYLEELK